MGGVCGCEGRRGGADAGGRRERQVCIRERALAWGGMVSGVGRRKGERVDGDPVCGDARSRVADVDAGVDVVWKGEL